MTLLADVVVERGDLSVQVSLAVPDGETVALVGPNGAGKTSFLWAVAGLIPSRGMVSLDGRPLDARRDVGIVFQDRLLFPHLSALDNVAFGLRCRGRTKAEARQGAQLWLDRLDIGHRAGAPPSSLSGGEAQRVALARALAPEPRLLLLDEPLSALDAGTKVDVRKLLVRHLRAFAGPRLIVTHDPVDAMTLADRLVILEAGRVVQEGAVAEVSTRPRSRYVAELVGVNLIDGRIAAGRLVAAGGAVTEGTYAVIHPRAVALFTSRPEGSPRNVWPVTVESIDLEGDRARVRVVGPIPLVAEVTSAAAAERTIGESLWASVKATEVETFAV